MTGARQRQVFTTLPIESLKNSVAIKDRKKVALPRRMIEEYLCPSYEARLEHHIGSCGLAFPSDGFRIDPVD